MENLDFIYLILGKEIFQRELEIANLKRENRKVQEEKEQALKLLANDLSGEGKTG